MAVHVSTDTGMRGSQETASFRNEVNNFGGRSMMMWDAISYARTNQLVHIPGNLNGARYKDEVLTPHMLPRNEPP